jgi:elongation factor 2
MQLLSKPDRIRNVMVLAPDRNQQYNVIQGLVAGATPIEPRHRCCTERRPPPALSFQKCSGISLYFPQTDSHKEILINVINVAAEFYELDIPCADGALIIVDSTIGITPQIHSIIINARKNRLKLALAISNIDQLIVSVQIQDIYQIVFGIVKSVNEIISSIGDEIIGENLLSPLDGNVCFVGSQWGFSLKQMAAFSCDILKNEIQAIEEYWNENGFHKLVLAPLKMIADYCFANPPQWDEINALLQRSNPELEPDAQNFPGNRLWATVMGKLLPASQGLVDISIEHIPSPIIAQSYRAEVLYPEPVAEAVRKCDPNGPLVVYLSGIVPDHHLDRPLTFGRVFSGTIQCRNNAFFINGTAHVLRIAPYILPEFLQIDKIPAGNIVVLNDVHQLERMLPITISSAENLVGSQTNFEPVVWLSVNFKNGQISAISKLAKQFRVEINDEYNLEIGAPTEIHLEKFLQQLRTRNIEINVSAPYVRYHETIIGESPAVSLTKSPNRHNWLYGVGAPASSDINLEQVWTKEGTNVLLNTSTDEMVNEITDSCIIAFKSLTEAGLLANEPLCNVQYNIQKVMLHADAIHRGMGQIIPSARKLFHLTQLTSAPRFMQPVFVVELVCTQQTFLRCRELLKKHQGTVLQEYQRENTNLVCISARLPVAESFGFRSASIVEFSYDCIHSFTLLDWELIPSDPLEEGSVANGIMLEIRQRKGLPLKIPVVADFGELLVNTVKSANSRIPPMHKNIT